MPRLLIIGVPDRPHYADSIRTLREYGYAVVTADRSFPRCFGALGEASLPIASYEDHDVLAAARGYHADHPFDGVALFQENWIEVSTRTAAALDLPHFPVDRVAGCRNKFQMRRWMREQGVCCPDFGQARDLAGARRTAARVGYPLVVKPQRGGASFGVTRIDDEAGLTRFFTHTDIFWEPRVFVLERYLQGREVSLETVVGRAGQCTHLTLFEKLEPLTGPYFLEETYVAPGRYPAATVRAVHAAVTEMISKLCLSRCILHTELRLTEDGPVVIEFGLRPIGWPGPMCVREVTGVDELLVMAQLACGEEPDIRPAPVSRAAGWRYLTVSKAGVVTAVRGFEELRDLPGLVSLSRWAEIGERVGIPPLDFNYIKGFVAVAANTADEVAALLKSAAVSFEVKPEVARF